MNRKNLTKKLITAGIGIVLLVSLMIPAYAAAGKMIEVFTDVSIYINGIKLNPTDANGNPVETFIYNGTTYVPLRAVSEGLGENVQWDGATRSVYIGNTPGSTTYLMDVCPPYETAYYKAPVHFAMAGKEYYNGFYLSSGKGYAYINTNGFFDNLSFTMGHVDGTGTHERTVEIYLDGKLSYEYEVSGDMYPQDISIPITGVMQVKIVIKQTETSTDAYGFGEITVS